MTSTGTRTQCGAEQRLLDNGWLQKGKLLTMLTAFWRLSKVFSHKKVKLLQRHTTHTRKTVMTALSM